MNKTTHKTAKTIKEYKVKCGQGHIKWDVTIPIGSKVSNSTALGYDDNYHFWIGWQKQIEKLTGFKNSMLAHDLTYYGVNIPAEYCEPYKNI